MNKILTIALAVIGAAALFSCKEEAPEPEAPEITVFLQALPEAMTFGYDDEDIQFITVIALNTGWRAEVESSAQEWLKITVESDNVRVRVEENTVEEPRTGKITIIPDDKTLNPVEIHVTQSLSEAIRINPNAGIAVFYGDIITASWKDQRDTTGFCCYTLLMADGDAYYYVNRYGRSLIYLANCYYIVLYLIADEVTPRDYQVKELKPGVYNIKMDPVDEQFEYEKWSCLGTAISSGLSYLGESVGGLHFYSSLIAKYENGKVIDQIVLRTGRVVIKEEGDDYSLSAEFISDRGQKIVIEYPGPFDLIRNTFLE